MKNNLPIFIILAGLYPTGCLGCHTQGPPPTPYGKGESIKPVASQKPFLQGMMLSGAVAGAAVWGGYSLLSRTTQQKINTLLKDVTPEIKNEFIKITHDICDETKIPLATYLSEVKEDPRSTHIALDSIQHIAKKVKKPIPSLELISQLSASFNLELDFALENFRKVEKNAITKSYFFALSSDFLQAYILKGPKRSILKSRYPNSFKTFLTQAFEDIDAINKDDELIGIIQSLNTNQKRFLLSFPKHKLLRRLQVYKDKVIDKPAFWEMSQLEGRKTFKNLLRL